MWPIKPEMITLRACEDFNWRVMASCPQCRYGVGINTRILAGSKYGAEPLHKLLERGAFKCRDEKRGCDGVAAERVTVTSMDVGIYRTIVEWAVLSPGSSASLVQCDLQQGGRPI